MAPTRSASRPRAVPPWCRAATSACRTRADGGSTFGYRTPTRTVAAFRVRARAIRSPARLVVAKHRKTDHGSVVAIVNPVAINEHAFGELALLVDTPRNATVVADTDVGLVVVGQHEFEGLLDEAPGFARKMLAGTAHRLREADREAV